MNAPRCRRRPPGSVHRAQPLAQRLRQRRQSHEGKAKGTANARAKAIIRPRPALRFVRRRWEELHQRHAGLAQEGARLRIGVVAGVDHAQDAGVDDHLGAVEAGLMGDVDRAAVDRHAVQRGLDDGVLLGVQRAHAVVVHDQTADVRAVGQAHGRAVVAGGQDALVLDDDRADGGAWAGAAPGHLPGDVHEVFVPGRPFGHVHSSVHAVITISVTSLSVSAGAELAVAGVAQAGHDVAALVQVRVDGGHVDVHIGMRRRQGRDPFGRGDDADELDPRGAPALEDVDRRHGRAAGGQHRVEDQADLHRRVDGQLVVVLHRLERALVAVQADVPDLGRRHHLPDAFDHAQAGAQDGHQADLLLQPGALGDGQRRLHVCRRQAQVRRGLVGQQDGDLAHQLAELLRLGAHVAQQRQLVAHQRVLRS